MPQLRGARTSASLRGIQKVGNGFSRQFRDEALIELTVKLGPWSMGRGMAATVSASSVSSAVQREKMCEEQ
jgi:hypothetical protein